jgi:uncharacterized protein
VRNSLSLLLILAVLGSAWSADPGDTARVRRARAVLQALINEDFVGAGKDFDEAMRKALPPEKLKTVWKDLNDKFGAYQEVTAQRGETKGKYELVIFRCKFTKQDLDCRVVFEKPEKVTGLAFTLAAKAYEFKPPAYAEPDTYREVPVVVGKDGAWPLPGTLTLPKGAGPFPAVVLLHGSGPHDRDETLMANKPLRDLAWGLASQGVAVLRFDKRTMVHAAKLEGAVREKFTVQEEVIDDALAALALLRTRKEIDPKRLFIVGHSLGATMAPVAALQDGKVAGVAMLAGNSRPLEDLVLEQYRYLASLAGKFSPDQEKWLADQEKKVARVKDAKALDAAKPEELPLDLAPAYWKGLRAADSVGATAKLTVPVLILQGERDYQVTMADFNGWKKALSGRKNIRFKSYPTFNHLFMNGEGKSTPAEYEKPAHVWKEVIDDLVGLVKGK